MYFLRAFFSDLDIVSSESESESEYLEDFKAFLDDLRPYSVSMAATDAYLSIFTSILPSFVLLTLGVAHLQTQHKANATIEPKSPIDFIDNPSVKSLRISVVILASTLCVLI